MTESCLAGVQKVFWAEGPRVSRKPLAPLQTGFASVPMPAETFCALSKALWARSADLTSVHGALVCKKPCPSFPWCSCFLGVFLAGNFLGSLGCFLLIFRVFEGPARSGDVFEVFLGVFENTKKKTKAQGSVNGGFQTVVRVLSAHRIPLPPF